MKKWIALITLSACTVGPNYSPPEICISDTWTGDAQENVSEVADTWWESFHDALLNKYIEKALECNNDILTAESNILQARALRQIASSSFYPKIGADVNATRTYFSKNGPIFAIGPSIEEVPGTVSPSTGLPFSLQVPQTQNLFNALFDASWEIDLFGKTKRMVEAADANIGRSIEQRNDTLLSVIAETARNYIEVRSLQTKYQLLQENIESLQQKADIIEKQLLTGYVNQLDKEQIDIEWTNEKAKLPNIQAEISQGIYTLSILIGEVPETLLEEMSSPLPLPTLSQSPTLGLRSDLLRRRPDIRQAERELAMATAGIGVAVASFFPTFTLIADAGFQSLLLRNLFSSQSKTWAFGGDFNIPIFQGGKLVGNLHLSQAVASAAAYSYQQIVLQALQETESALASYTASRKASKELTQGVEKQRLLLFLSSQRHKAGLVNKLDVLDKTRELNHAEESLLNSHTTTLLCWIALHKALGGGLEN